MNFYSISLLSGNKSEFVKALESCDQIVTKLAYEWPEDHSYIRFVMTDLDIKPLFDLIRSKSPNRVWFSIVDEDPDSNPHKYGRNMEPINTLREYMEMEE